MANSVRARAIAVTLVAVVALAARFVGADDTAALAVLSSAAVAFAALIGGMSGGIAGALAAVLALRVADGAALGVCIAFTASASLIAVLVTRLADSAADRTRRLDAADRRIGQLEASERRLRAIDAACARLEDAAPDCAIALLDGQGRVAAWRPSAVRLFQIAPDEMIGSDAKAAFGDALYEAMSALVRDRTAGAVGTFAARLYRRDGTAFDADVEMRAASIDHADGFTIVVRDRSRQQRWEAYTASAERTEAALRAEADVAQRQLATLQHVTDPDLNALPFADAAKALLDRLLMAIDADGVAFVRAPPFRRTVMFAPSGLDAPVSTERRDVRVADDRILLVHNDRGRVTASSQIDWPEGVSSLIAVPVVAGGRVEGTIEVVMRRARRSTEWEIALIQVVAARIAGRVPDSAFVSANAVA